MKDDERLSSLIVDALFLLPQMTGDGVPLEMPGVRGWMSSRYDSYASRVGFTNMDNADSKISEIIRTFEIEGKGFTFVLGPKEIRDGLGAKLLTKGLRPARFFSLAGMHCVIEDVRPSYEITIERVSLEQAAESAALISQAYGIPQGDVGAIWGARIIPPPLNWDLHLAYTNRDGCNEGEPVGFGASALIEDDSILLLRGSGVLPTHRRRGIYRELILQRMNLALQKGVKHAIVQSARNSSYDVLRSIGFAEICSIEWYEWKPLLL